MSCCHRVTASWLSGLVALAITCAGDVHAQSAPATADVSAPFGMPMDDQSVLFHAELDQFEARFDADETGLRWDGEAWVGTDENRLWFKSEGYAASGLTRDGQDEALYDRALTTYFNLQAGVRYDLDSLAGRGWGAIGLEGLAPYNLKLSITAYASDAGHYAMKIAGYYDLLLTQRLILEPQVELNGYTRSDQEMQVAAGWSQLDGGLRLRYEISRKFAPYLGITYTHVSVPAAANFDQWRLAGGFRVWF